MRHILLVVYIMLFAITANSEVYNFQAISFSIRTENNDGSMSDWTAWNSSNDSINYDTDKDKIKIYSNDTFDFDVYDIQRETDDNGGNVIALSCVDAEGKKCTIDIRNAVFGGIQLYVRYADVDAAYEVEPPANIRKLFPNYVESQITSNSVSSQLSGGKKSNGSVSSNSTPYLTLSQTSINAGAAGTTQTISVASNRAWEIQYPTGNMYSVTRNGNTLKVTIFANTGTGTREDFFNVRLVDGSKAIKVHLWQPAPVQSQSSSSFYGSSSSRSNYSNNSSTHYTRTSAYQRYIHHSGSINVTWIGISAGIGSGMSILGSTLRCRFGPVEIRPVDIAAIDYNFVNGDYNFSYQPIIDFHVPVSADKAIYFGAGPSVGLIETNLWFRAEGGLHWNWGGDHASSDFFFRYDGAYMVGLSIQCSSHW